MYGEGFVVAHQHVEARLHLLDVVGFEQQRLGLGRGRDEDHRDRQRDHAGDAVGVAGRAHVAGDALAHALRLADVEHLSRRRRSSGRRQGPSARASNGLRIAAAPAFTDSGAASSSADIGRLQDPDAVEFVLVEIVEVRSASERLRPGRESSAPSIVSAATAAWRRLPLSRRSNRSADFGGATRMKRSSLRRVYDDKFAWVKTDPKMPHVARCMGIICHPYNR